MRHWGNTIAGESRPAIADRWIELENPATGECHGRVPDSAPEDLEAAVRAAREAFPAWSRRSPEERAEALDALAASVEEHLEELALLESEDNGKPLALARRVDIPRAARNLHFFASSIRQFASESHRGAWGQLNVTLRKAVGIAGCISPWILPLYLFTWKIAPALAAGNCVIGKPSEITPATAARLGELARDCGFPPGVLNIVHGRGAEIGAALCAHPDIPLLSFTGGTVTGAAIARATAGQFKKLSLELGGKNPTLVFADADREAALEGALRAGYTNQGQICLCGSRLLVQEEIYEDFREALLERVRALRVGDPLAESTDQGALVSAAHKAKVLSYIALAREEGGRLLCGGEELRLPGRLAGGHFVSPALVEGLGPESRCNREEIFGPVVTLQRFRDTDEALRLANASRYGLAASVWTRDLPRAHRLAEELQAGIVWVNCWMERDLRTPFGGMKDSGLGREGGLEALRFFTEAKNICFQLEEES